MIRRAGPALTDRIHIETQRLRALDADALARSLDALDPRQCDCAIVVASQEPSVLAAVDQASRRGIVVLTLVSDLPLSARRHFIGIDNLAAGRTAASLLGRFLPQGGTVAVIAGLAASARSFRPPGRLPRRPGRRIRPCRADRPGGGPRRKPRDRGHRARPAGRHPDLGGLYNLGAGNAGLVAALEQSGRAGRIRVIAHELTEPTRRGLRTGAIDVVLDQNPDGEIRAGHRRGAHPGAGGQGRRNDGHAH